MDASDSNIITSSTIWGNVHQIINNYQEKPSSDLLKQLFLIKESLISSSIVERKSNNFIGRQNDLKNIQDIVFNKSKTGGIITINANAGEGKSSIIAKLLSMQNTNEIPYFFIENIPNKTVIDDMIISIIITLVIKHKSLINSINLPLCGLNHTLRIILQEISRSGYEEVIYIDGLDQLFKESNGYRDLSFIPNELLSGIVFVLGTRPGDTILGINHKFSYYNDRIDNYRLSRFSITEFNELINSYKIKIPENNLMNIYNYLENNILYLKLFCQEYSRNPYLSFDNLIRNKINLDSIYNITFERIKKDKNIINILGLLLSHKAPLDKRIIGKILNLDQITIEDSITQINGLLETTNNGYIIYHKKLSEFLEPRLEDNISEYHRLIIEYYKIKGGKYYRDNQLYHLYKAERFDEVINIIKNTNTNNETLFFNYTEIALNSAKSNKDLLNVWEFQLKILTLQHKNNYWPNELYIYLYNSYGIDYIYNKIAIIENIIKKLDIIINIIPHIKKYEDIYLLISYSLELIKDNHKSIINYLYLYIPKLNNIINKLDNVNQNYIYESTQILLLINDFNGLYTLIKSNPIVKTHINSFRYYEIFNNISIQNKINQLLEESSILENIEQNSIYISEVVKELRYLEISEYIDLESELNNPENFINKILSIKPNSSLNNIVKSIITFYLYKNNPDNTLLIIKNLVNINYKDELYFMVSEFHINNQDIQKAIEVIKILQNQDYKDDLYFRISEFYINNHNIGDAVKIIRFIKNQDYKNDLYFRIGIFYLDTDNIKKYRRNMTNVTKSNPNYRNLLSKLSIYLAKLNKINKSINLIREIIGFEDLELASETANDCITISSKKAPFLYIQLEIIELIKDDIIFHKLLINISNSLANSNMFTQALNLVDKANDNGLRLEILLNVANKQYKQDSFKNLLETLDKIQNIEQIYINGRVLDLYKYMISDMISNGDTNLDNLIRNINDDYFKSLSLIYSKNISNSYNDINHIIDEINKIIFINRLTDIRDNIDSEINNEIEIIKNPDMITKEEEIISYYWSFHNLINYNKDYIYNDTQRLNYKYQEINKYIINNDIEEVNEIIIRELIESRNLDHLLSKMHLLFPVIKYYRDNGDDTKLKQFIAGFDDAINQTSLYRQ